MKKLNGTEVLIDGRKYTICGVEGDEYLQKIASYINRKLTEFKKRETYQRMDMELRNIMLAINIADDYYKAKKRVQEFKSEGEKKDKQALDMKHEIIGLQDKLKDMELKNGVIEASLEEAEKKIVELETKINQRSKSRR